MISNEEKQRLKYNQACWVVVTAGIWLGVTYIFWLGYVGTDDVHYARYAYFLHRLPINHWEFRIPAILAIRASFSLLGPTEFAACLPGLIASATILFSVAWLVDWPRTLSWESQGAMILASVFPLDVAFRSIPSAPYIAGAFLSLGTVCILKRGKKGQIIGPALLSLGFLTHATSFFYIGTLCVTALMFDHRRFWRPVLLCIAFSGCLIMLESTTYYFLIGDPFARYRTASIALSLSNIHAGVDQTRGIYGLAFFLWPIKNLIFCKHFGFDLIVLLVCSTLMWKQFKVEYRILLITTFVFFFWLGFGTQLPWAYKPFGRAIHWYFPITLGVSVLLPYTVFRTFKKRKVIACGIIVILILVHVASSAAGGKHGSQVDVSRELLRYAQQHGSYMYLTDVSTMNEMYVIKGFQFPENVICLNGSAVKKHLRVNQEPPGSPRYFFPDMIPDFILINLDRRREAQFERYLHDHGGQRRRIVEARYRQFFLPLLQFLEPAKYMLKSLGGEVVKVENKS